MAIKDNNTKSPISAGIVAAADPTAAQAIARKAIGQAQTSSTVALKAPTESRLKAETTQPAQAVNPDKPASEQELFTERFKQLQLMESSAALFLNKLDLTDMPFDLWIKNNAQELGPNFDPNDKIDRSYAAFRQENPQDREITARYEYSGQTPYSGHFATPSGSAGHQGRRQSSSTSTSRDENFTPPAYKLDKHQARTELAADIKTVSEIYAAEAGLSPRDMAKVVAGIATIESSMGVLREVKGTKFKSSAGGALHYLNGTIEGETAQAMNDPRIAQRVEQLGVSFETVNVKKNGKTVPVQKVSEEEAWILKQDNILACSILAKQIIAIAKKNPELRGDIDALTTRVYQSHNLGPAGASALARGGREALENLDHRAPANNPLFFGGGASDETINKRYTTKVAAAIDSAEPLLAVAFGDEDPRMLASAKASAGVKATVAIAKAAASSKADLRTPEPTPS